jgi:xylulokinase
MERDGLVLAADVGGSALKLGLVDGSGGLLAAAARPLAERLPPATDRVEQDARVWWDAFTDLAAGLVAGRAERVRGLVVTGATRSEVLVDATGRPLLGAILFRDRRARAEAEELAADPALAAALPIDASHPLARLLWLARHAGPTLDRASYLLEPKDFLAFQLSGVAARDPLAAARLEAPGVVEAARRHSLPLALLAPIRPLGARLGGLRPEVAAGLGLAPGLPVLAAPMDAWCATLAIGAVAPGRAYASAGSSEVAGLVVDRPVAAPGLLAPPWGEGLWHLGGPSLAGGAGLDWLARLLSRPLEALLEDPGEALPGETAPLALPWLAGERVPFAEPGLRARLLGLEEGHGPADLVRAWLEALAFWDRLVLDRAEAAAGCRATELRLTGGLAAAPAVARLKAAALGRPVLAFAAREGALLGAAGLTWTALGRYADLVAAQTVLAAAPRRVEASAAEHALADRRFARWRAEVARACGSGAS